MNIFDADSWREIFQTLSRNRRRSVFTALGVVWGTFMLILLLGVGNGISGIIKKNAGDAATNSMVIYGSYTGKPYGGFQSGRLIEIETADAAEIGKLEGITGVAYASDTQYGDFTFENEKYSSSCMSGINGEMIKTLSLETIKGRMLNRVDQQQRRKVCVAPLDFAETISDNPEDIIGKYIEVSGTKILIIGVFRAKNNTINISYGRYNFYMPYSTYTNIFGDGMEKISCMIVTADDNRKIDKYTDNIKSILYRRHTIAPDDDQAIFTLSMGFIFDKVNGFFKGFSLLIWVVGLGSLFAGIVGINNIMLIVVRERRQEIGVRRALGAKPSSIMGQIIAESCILTIMAGMTGMMLAIAVAIVLDNTLLVAMLSNMGTADPTATFVLSPSIALVCMAIIIAMSVAIGMLPARKALSIKAIDALREE